MASLDSLPSDQRAVLQMVLGRGRDYDEIAQMLSIDRAGVRDRALAALDSLGPSTRVSAGRRALITDYLLGQLPRGVSEQTRDRLAGSASERAWARVVASELAPLSSGPLPEIPVESGRGGAEDQQPIHAPESGRISEPERIPEPERTFAGEPTPEPEDAPKRESEPAGARPPRSSRLGGAILLGIGAVIVIAVVILFIVNSGSSKPKQPVAASKGAPAANTQSTSTSTTATPVAQINLLSPTGKKTTAGIAEVLKRSSTTAIAIVGQGIPPNTKHDAYAVWLYNSPRDAYRLGFVNPGVGKNGRLETAGGLPADAARFKQLLITLETTANPRSPGQIVLEGTLKGV